MSANKKVKQFSMKFRSLKDNTQSTAVLKKRRNHSTGKYSHVFNSNTLRSSETLPETLNFDSRLIRNRLGHYYLCLPVTIELRGENQAPEGSACRHSTISLDPGVRTFTTDNDADEVVSEWDHGDMGIIFRLCYAHDQLQANWFKPDV